MTPLPIKIQFDQYFEKGYHTEIIINHLGINENLKEFTTRFNLNEFAFIYLESTTRFSTII